MSLIMHFTFNSIYNIPPPPMNNAPGPGPVQSVTPTIEQMDIARWLFGLEMCVHLLALPVAIFSLSLLIRTSVLHPNLKFVLLSQTVAILIRSSLRIPAISIKFAVQNPFWSEANLPPLQFGLLSTVFFRNFLGHVILAERVLATIYVRNYEWKRRFRWFSPLWAIPLLLLAIWNGLDVKLPGQEQKNFFPLTSTINLATGQATLFFNIFEFIVLALLVRYNRRRFAETGQRQNVHNLSERYQLLENIRTTRQLLPILALHSLSNLNNSAIQMGQIFKLFSNPTAQFLVDTNTLGFFNASILTLAMLIATIVSHPILYRSATLGLLRARNTFLGRKGSVKPTTTSVVWPNGPIGQQKNKEEYFKVLNKFWEQEFRNKADSV